MQHMIFRYLQRMTYLQCVNWQSDTSCAKENPPTGLYSQSYQVSESVGFQVVADSVSPRPLQDPAPKLPAFSAISSEVFRFWSKSSHLKMEHLQWHEQLDNMTHKKQCNIILSGLPDWHFQRIERVLESKIRIDLINFSQKRINTRLTRVRQHNELYS